MSKDLPREVLSQLIWAASEQGERASREPPSNAPSTSSDPDPNPNMPCRKRKQLPAIPEKRKGMGRFGKKCRLLSMLWLTTGFFFVEIVVGYVTNSMALVADSFHMLSDVAALIIAFISVKMSPKKWSKNTFGWARAEVLGALVNAVFLVALCFSITVEACKRFIEPEEIHDPQLLLIVGGAGLAVNLIGLALFHEHGSSKNHSHSPHGLSRSRNRLTQLAVTDDNENDETYPSPPPQEPPARSHGHGHSHGGGGGMHGHSHSLNMNMRGVFLHVLSDALGSVIVVISALVVWLSDWKYKYYLDPALSIILVVLILKSVWPLLKDSALILLQTVPTHIQVDDIQRRLLAKVDGVLAVHEFHVWQLAGDRIIASAHIRCRNLSEYMKIAGKVKEFFHNEGIHSTTIQPEFVDYADYPANSDDGEQTDDCILDCPNTLSDSCIMNTCCGPSKEGKDTPSPGDTPYLCRQRTSTTSSLNRTQEMNEMENGALLNEVTAMSASMTECCCNTRNCACNAQIVSIVGPESCV